MSYDPWGKEYRPGFSDDMKQIHGIGPIYYFVTNRGSSKRVQRGFVREIDPPYRRGQGVQLQAFGRVFGLGLCRKGKFDNDYEATKSALEAKDLSEDQYDKAIEIGDWRVSEEG